MAVELVIGIVLVALLAGVGIGYYLLGTGRANKAKAAVTELESALETAQTELADYKRDVFGEFAQTAEKFRALDKSYNDLHRQLAESSVALCGDDGTLLLESPEAPSLDVVEDQLADEEIVVAEAPESEQPETVEGVGTQTEAQTEAEPQAEAPSGEALQDSERAQETDPVPILTEVEATGSRRESA